jgi:hypothetical protein
MNRIKYGPRMAKVLNLEGAALVTKKPNRTERRRRQQTPRLTVYSKRKDGEREGDFTNRMRGPDAKALNLVCTRQGAMWILARVELFYRTQAAGAGQGYNAAMSDALKSAIATLSRAVTAYR